MSNPPRKRIAPEERLRGRDTIHRVFEVGQRARRGKVVARFVFADDRPVPLRFGVAVTRKIPTAVLRNRCKRWMREAVREHKGTCTMPLREGRKSADVMFIWVDPAMDKSMHLFADVSVSVRDLLLAISAAAFPAYDVPPDRVDPAV